MRKDKAYSFTKNIHGSPPYYQHELLARIHQLGTPTWFFTLSAVDMKWPDMTQTIAKQYGVHYTDEEVNALSLRKSPIGSNIILLQQPGIFITDQLHFPGVFKIHC